MFHNSMPRYEILSSDALATLDSYAQNDLFQRAALESVRASGSH